MITHENPLVQATGQEIADRLADIADMFKPGAKLTLLVRHPDYPNGDRDVVITDDSLAAVIDALRIRLAPLCPPE